VVAALALLTAAACSGDTGSAIVPPPAQRFEVEGMVDLERAAARYTSTLTDRFQSQGVIVIGHALCAPDEAEGHWLRSRRPDSEQAWVEQRFLPYDGGGLLTLVGLAQATPSGEAPVEEDGRVCGTAHAGEGTSVMRYCVDRDGRLRSVRATSDDGVIVVRYEDLGRPVDVTAPPEHTITEFDVGLGDG
jgi:hypothetical protein